MSEDTAPEIGIRAPTVGWRIEGFGFCVWEESAREARRAARELEWPARVLRRGRRRSKRARRQSR